MKDIHTLQARIQEHIDEGAKTPGAKSKARVVIQLLNEALETESACVARYERHYLLAAEIGSESVRADFFKHAHDEKTHVDRIALRLGQLGEKPNSSEGSCSCSHPDAIRGEAVPSMIKEDFVVERIVIASYRAMIKYIGHFDPVSVAMLEGILKTEEDHAETFYHVVVKHARIDL
jgi:bacterioferritin